MEKMSQKLKLCELQYAHKVLNLWLSQLLHVKWEIYITKKEFLLHRFIGLARRLH